MFVFGDNNEKWGKKGQALIRDKSNAFGIPTETRPGGFYRDSNLEDNKRHINEAIKKIIEQSSKYDTIYFPQGGIGTGLAKLKESAPETWKYLIESLKTLFGVENSDKTKLV